jgi:hypothetical protein
LSGLPQITQVTYSKTPLLVVGSGPWGDKIQKILTKNISDIEIFRVSAHDFINNILPHKLDPVRKYNLWIATRPEIQLVILDQIKDQSGLCILEKPLAINSEQMERYYQLTQGTRMDFAISKPWNFSSLWRTAMSIIPRNLIDVEIEIWRGDEKERDYLPSYIDWLPHDAYLLSELIKDKPNLEIEARLVHEGRTAEIQISGDNYFKVKFSFGYFENGRKTFWLVRQGDKSLLIDFEKSIIKSNFGLPKNGIIDCSKDNPIVTMYVHFCTRGYKGSNELFLFSRILQALETR